MNRLDYFFENLKNGDVLGFHYKKWYYIIGRIIFFVSYIINPARKKLFKIEHVGQICNVEKEDDYITFTFGESTGHDKGKVTNRYILQKVGDKYLIDSRFRNKGISLYLLPCVRKLTLEENKILNDFWKQKEKYDAFDAVGSVDWIQRLFKLFRTKKVDALNNFCSGEVEAAFNLIGFKNKDSLPTPSEIINQSYINKAGIVKIC